MTPSHSAEWPCLPLQNRRCTEGTTHAQTLHILYSNIKLCVVKADWSKSAICQSWHPLGQSFWPIAYAFPAKYISKKRGVMAMFSVANKKETCDTLALLSPAHY